MIQYKKYEKFRRKKLIKKIKNRSIEFLSNLKFLKNKEYLLSTFDDKFNISLSESLLINELEERGIFYSLDNYGYSMRIFCNNWDIKVVNWINYWFNSTSVSKIFIDKILTNQILK